MVCNGIIVGYLKKVNWIKISLFAVTNENFSSIVQEKIDSRNNAFHTSYNTISVMQ